MKKKSKVIFLMVLSVLYFYFGNTSHALIAPTPNHIEDLSAIFTIPQINNNAAFQQNGVVTVTSIGQNQVGAIWSSPANYLDFTKDFTMVTHLNSGDRGDQSGDGMAFVIQAETPSPKWFTGSGAQMGFLAANNTTGPISTAIPASFGIEFDLYGNNYYKDGLFDADIIGGGLFYNQHIAHTFPADPSFYSVRSGERVLKHVNPKLMILGNGNWNKLTVHWDAAVGQLSYQVNNDATIYVNQADFNRNVTSHSKTAYWGFTGSTGSKFQAKQQVVFEQVPGLIDAHSEIQVERLTTGESLEKGAYIRPEEKLKFNYSYEYLAGHLSWKNIVATLAIGTDIKVEPGSIKLTPWYQGVKGEEVALADATLSGTTLRFEDPAYNELDLDGVKPSKLTISYTGSLKKEFVTTAVELKGNAKGSNAMFETSFNLQTADWEPPSVTITNEPDEKVSDGADKQTFSGTWTDASDHDLKLAYYVDDQVVGEETIIKAEHEGDNSWTYDYSLPEALAYGPHTFKIKATSGTGKSSEVVAVTFIKISVPVITAVNGTLVVERGQLLKLDVQWHDKKNEEAELFSRIGDQDYVLVTALENPVLGETQQTQSVFDTTNLEPGSYTISHRIKNKDGHYSNSPETDTVEIMVLGTIRFTSGPRDFNVEAEITSKSQAIKVSGMDKIGITDSRWGEGEWRLRATLKAEDGAEPQNFVNDAGKEADADFLVYQDGKGGSTPIDKRGATILTHQSTSTSEVIVNQEADAGFFINTKPWMYKGIYKSKINWEIIIGP